MSSIYRSYFLKNATLIKNIKVNNSQNPVGELSYGTENKQIGRFIFDFDLEPLKNKILNNEIKQGNIKKHILHLTNTIAYYPDYIGKPYNNDESIKRATSFKLDLFNITENWDEGSGYEIIYDNTIFPLYPTGATNWFKKTTLLDWTQEGAFISGGTSEIIDSQNFTLGNENIDIDITDYINSLLFTGTTGFTGTTFGLGLKFSNEYEQLSTVNRNVVAFFAKETNTFFEPYVETIIDDEIIDDRNYFYLDKNNNLYIYSYIGNQLQDIVVNYVTIYDYEDNEILILSGNTDIINIKKGIYKINLNLDSDTYPDAVIFRDVWNVTINGKNKDIEQEFYVISDENYYNLNNNNQFKFNPENYYFNFFGIKENEKIKANDIKNVKILVKELYSNQNNFIPLDIEYRIFITAGTNYEIDVIPFTKVNRNDNNYEFNIDTFWLIPQDYYLEIRLVNNNIYFNKNRLKFSVINEKII